MMEHRGAATLSLLGAGLLSEGAYAAITVRLPWWRYGGELTSWSRILGAGWDRLFICLAGIAGLMAAYAWGWRAVRRGAGRGLIWAFAGLYAATLFWLLPITSDLFIYLARAHLFTDLHGNPLHDTLVEQNGDPLLAAYPAAYAGYSSVYGPAWTFLSAPGTLGRYDVATGVAYLKGLAVVAFAGSAWLIERMLRRYRPHDAAAGLYLFAWNPLVLLLAVGDGHNDMALMALVLAAFWLLLVSHWGVAFGVLSVAVWVKYVGAIFFPLFLLHGWRQRAAENRPGWSLLLQAGLAGMGVTAVLFVPFGNGSALSILVTRLMTPVNWGGEAGRLPAWAMALGLILFVAAYVLIIRQMGRGDGSFQHLANMTFVVALLAFVLGAARSQPWHLIWPATLAGLSDRRWAWPIIVVLSAAMLVTQVWVEWGMPGLGGL